MLMIKTLTTQRYITHHYLFKKEMCFYNLKSLILKIILHENKKFESLTCNDYVSWFDSLQ